MSWTLNYSAEDRILSVKCRGAFTGADLDHMTKACVKKLREEHALRVLLDFSSATAQVSLAELYTLPDIYTELRAPRLAHIAIVIPADAHGISIFQFYEDLAINRGYFVKLLANETDARNWLMEFNEA